MTHLDLEWVCLPVKFIIVYFLFKVIQCHVAPNSQTRARPKC